MAIELEHRLALEWEAVSTTDLPEIDDVIQRAAPENASRRATLVELEDVRASCVELRGRLESADGLEMRATSRWTVRDVIAHLASWARRTRIELESLVEAGTGPERIHFERDGGPRVWNQREVDARQGRTPAALFEELDAEIARIADVVVAAPSRLLHQVVELPRTSGNPATPWRMPVVAMVLGSCWHARHHLVQLERLMQP